MFAALKEGYSMKAKLWLGGILSALGVCAPAYAQWVNAGHITKVHSGTDGSFFFSAETVNNSANCPGTHQYAVSVTDVNAGRIYSLLLSAYLNGTPISILLSGTCLASGYPGVLSVQIKDPGVPF
jgi:hypothetical protein